MFDGTGGGYQYDMPLNMNQLIAIGMIDEIHNYITHTFTTLPYIHAKYKHYYRKHGAGAYYGQEDA